MEHEDAECCLGSMLQVIPQHEVARRILQAAEKACECILKGNNPPPLIYSKATDVHGRVVNSEIRYESGNQRAFYVQVWGVLSIIATLCVKEETCTLRSLYYRSKSMYPKSSRSYDGVSAAVQVAVGLLHVPRPCLGLVAASRGEFFGNIRVRTFDGEDNWIDCRKCVAPIPGDLRQVDSWQIQIDAQFILVVEKEAVLHRLYKEKFHHKVPVVVMTAKGMPDLASRSFLRKLHVEAALPVAAVVDWNPSGVIILHTFAQGGLHRLAMLEASDYVIPDLLWLGIHREQLSNNEIQNFGQPLSERDHAILDNMLKSRCLDCRPGWKSEVEFMKRVAKKLDIEALIDGGNETELSDLLAKGILQERFV